MPILSPGKLVHGDLHGRVEFALLALHHRHLLGLESDGTKLHDVLGKAQHSRCAQKAGILLHPVRVGGGQAQRPGVLADILAGSRGEHLDLASPPTSGAIVGVPPAQYAINTVQHMPDIDHPGKHDDAHAVGRCLNAAGHALLRLDLAGSRAAHGKSDGRRQNGPRSLLCACGRSTPTACGFSCGHILIPFSFEFTLLRWQRLLFTHLPPLVSLFTSPPAVSRGPSESPGSTQP